MGHYVGYETFSTKTSKEQIKAELDEIALSEGDTGSCLPKIRFYDDKCCVNYDEAVEFIEKADKGWYDQLAVKYKEQPREAKNKKIADLERRYSEVTHKIVESRNFYFANHKSKYIGCKKCGSKLSLAHMNTNYCPLCHCDLRPESEVNRVQKLQDKKVLLEKQIKAEEKVYAQKNFKKGKEMWLVKYEFHC